MNEPVRGLTVARSVAETQFPASTNSKPSFLRGCIRIYLSVHRCIWRHLPAFVRSLSFGRAYGEHLHRVVCCYSDRKQNHSTFFMRNRPELELMCQLLKQKPSGALVNISVIACSKGAEVYSFLRAIRSARPDLRINLRAVDISQEIIDFAANGIYSHNGTAETNAINRELPAQKGDVT